MDSTQTKAAVGVPVDKQSQSEAIGRRLGAARLAMGITEEDAAFQLGMRRHGLKRAEAGRLPSVTKLLEMLALYGASAQDVLTGGGQCELSRQHSAELQELARTASPGLQAKVAVLVSLYSVP